jgi:hypothetical protein
LDCDAGRCPEFRWVQSDAPVVNLTADSTNLYWYSDDTVWQALKADVTSVTVSLVDVSDLEGLAADGSHVYWIEQGSVSRIPVDGGPTEQISTAKANLPTSLALSENNVYWTNSCDPSSGTVWMAAKDGSDPMPTGVSNLQNCPREIVVSGADPYWVNAPDAAGTVCKGVVGTTIPQPLGGSYHASLLAADPSEPSYVYYAEQTALDGYGIFRVTRDFSNQTAKKLASGAGQVGGLAASGGMVYWTTTATSSKVCSVSRVAAEGGDVLELSSLTPSDCGGIAVSDGFVYWVRTNGAKFEIARVAK